MSTLGPLGPDEAGSPIALAVSGGGDSMALAFLAKSWRAHIIAFIVDHALRSESREEAELTGQRLAKIGVPFRILTLDKLKAGGLQEQARDARYAILEKACQDVGASILMLAHHQADQEETLWMRQEKKSGLEGMVGMAPRSYRRSLVLLRPFLSLRPERLKQTLRTEGLAWCEDPSNENRRFKRVQVRQDLTEQERSSLRKKQACSVRHYQQLEEQLSVLLSEKIQVQKEGWVILSLDLWEALDADLAHFLLGRMIRLIGGRAYLPSSESLTQLLEKREGTLGGVVLRKRLSQGVVKDFILYRELRDIISLEPFQEGSLWDRRWLYRGGNKPGYRIDALADHASVVRVERDVPVAVLKTVPALWYKDKLVAVADGVRGLSSEVPRAPFLWQGGMKIVGAKVFY